MNEYHKRTHGIFYYFVEGCRSTINQVEEIEYSNQSMKAKKDTVRRRNKQKHRKRKSTVLMHFSFFVLQPFIISYIIDNMITYL